MVAVFAAVALVGACSSDDPPGTTAPSSSAPASPGQEKVLQSRTVLFKPEIRLDLLSLDRVSDKVVTARIRANNPTAQKFSFSFILAPYSRDPKGQLSHDPNSVGGIALLDGGNARLHYPLVGPDRRCLCTRSFAPEVAAGGTLTFDAAFPAPPADVKTLDLVVPATAPFVGVPVGSRPGGKIDLDAGMKGVDPTTAKLGPQRVLPVTAVTETGTGSEADDGDDLSVRISTDVLFKINKADLTPAAQATLREVADKIQRSPGKTVTIEGHADSTGNAAINQPLSERRAKSVEAALKPLVNKPGLVYQPKGYGSSRPLVPNDTPEGRKKNRRVAITFAKPAPATTASPGASGAQPAKGRTLQPTDGPKGASIQVEGLRRGADGVTVLTWTLKNGGSAPVPADSMFTAPPVDGYTDSGPSGVVLTAADKRFRVMRDSERRALVMRYEKAGSEVDRVPPGGQQSMYAVFKVPADVTAVALEFPGFAKAENVAVE
ncbi:OmpA family protein [Actinomadura sp. 9N407]|uniref:OmpA family protein n=1 Tax=Actinomadura sp. 9N407 TaxID=3375154 RepID=UPI0037893C71